MTSTLLAMGLVMALTQAPSPSRDVTFQGCVTPGVDPATYVVTGVRQVTAPDSIAIPEVAHGRRVLFWLDNDDAVRTRVGRRVEVSGTFKSIEESEIEFKAGRQQAGGFVVEFEGPGRDVRSADPAVGAAVGTGGRVVPEQDDVKTYLMRIDVKNVRTIADSCQ